jgi:hypothetical protein
MSEFKDWDASIEHGGGFDNENKDNEHFYDD